LSGSTRHFTIYNGSSNSVLGTVTNTPLIFQTNDSTRMTLDASGNLMVGSANAGNAGTINVSVGAAGTTAGGLQLWAATNQTHFIQFGDGTTGAQVYAGYLAYAHSTDSLLFGTNGADKMTLTSSGNLGLGVNPSAWDGTLVKAIQLADNGASLSSFSTGNTSSKFAILSNNAYYDSGGWKYLQSATSAQYRIANQEHQWYTAPSGTAGNAISFTQAVLQ